MIVPWFIVNRIYRKGSLRREPGGYWAFSFRNTLARGTATLTGPERVAVKSPIGSVELSRFPDLFVDGRPVPKEDAMMVIGDREIPHYDEEEARRRVGESIQFSKGDDFITRVRGDLPDGRHEFRAVFHSTQFGEIVLNFSDSLGRVRRSSVRGRLAERLKGLLGRQGRLAEPGDEAGPAEEPVRETALFVLKGKRPDPDFGRLLTAFERKEPDRVPLIELNVDEEVKTALLGRPVAGMRDEVEFWLAAGYDYVPLWVVNVTPRRIEMVDSHRTTYKEGLQERAWIVESEGMIATREDLEQCDWPEVEDSLFANFEEIEPYLPPEMKVIGSISAVFEPVTQAMGLQTFCLNLHDDPGLIEAMIEKVGHLTGQCLERMLEFDCVGAVWLTDDLAYRAGPMISPELLRQYVFPWYKRFTDQIHAKGFPALFHSCGNTEPLFDDILEAGFDALHPLEPLAVDIFEAKETIGERICLCGNLDMSYLLTRASTEEITEETKKYMRRLGPGGGYCLGSANSIANYVPLDKYLAMNRTCLEHGRYPIRA